MTDTELLEAIFRYEWQVMHVADRWVVFGPRMQRQGEGGSPRGAVEDAVLKLEADLSLGRPNENR